MTPTSMNALVFSAAGKPEDVLSMQNIPVPQPGNGEVLVKISARPIHPADLMFIGGRYRIKPLFPQVAGLEGTGIVLATGTGVSVEIGTHVAFRHAGSWAEFACVPVAKLNVVPTGMSSDNASQFSLNPVTAWGLLDETRAVAGDWIAINAATSGVARLVHGLARRRGIHVLGIVRGLAGASPSFPMVSMQADDLAAAILEKTSGAPIAGLLDCVGGLSITRAFAAMRQGAVIVSYGVMETTAAQVTNVDMIYRNLTWKGFGVDYWLTRNSDRFTDVARDIWAAMAAGAIDLPVKSRHALAAFHAALNDMNKTPNTGKILLTTNGNDD